ncbi:hypothetical protein PHYBOEH_009118 [Phytophthora boehmeriae]|uniref:RING-type domain-containing protein n=1 Tax=Phytophthora boehmeriae TaxID=109152 RepID=A0A8T1X0V5_9STRA|nr:hypothetical protein PHYBOEH_009118 [Phytophthora boehmeriae]
MEDEEQKRDPVDVEEAHAAADGAIPHPDGTEAGVVVEKTEEDADVVHALTQGFLPNCAHRFHFECIVAWAKVTNLCPLCKTKFHSVALHDAHGHIVRTKTICDQKQIFKPNPADHDIAAQLSLVNQARCELCGSGEDEHLLLMCEALGCGVANHTYCIGLRQVPNSSWYCSSHAAMQQRASDAIPRPATTVSTRRRTRRLASLMSNVLGGNRNVDRGNSNFIAVEQEEERRPMRGIAAAYALRMSRELMQVQLRADAMFARGDLTQSSLYGRNTARQGTRSTVSTIDQMWEDQHRSRQEMAAAALAGRSQESTTQGDNGGNSRLSVSRNFAAEYRELAKLMRDAASSDNYASTVTLMIPKTARLRLVSRVKTFFGRLNKKEKAVAIELGCLSVLHQWIRSPEQHDNATSISTPNPQVLDAVLSILETLPIRKEDLVENFPMLA